MRQAAAIVEDIRVMFIETIFTLAVSSLISQTPSPVQSASRFLASFGVMTGETATSLIVLITMNCLVLRLATVARATPTAFQKTAQQCCCVVIVIEATAVIAAYVSRPSRPSASESVRQNQIWLCVCL